MMRKLATTLAMACALLALGPGAHADWDTGLVHVQGVLTDPAGLAVPGPVSLTIGLYPTAEGGAAVWSESHPQVEVADGVFSVLLGAQAPLWTAEGGNLFAQHPQLWMGVSVDGGAELARTRMAAMGLAYQAQHAEVCEVLAGAAWDVDCTGCVGAQELAVFHGDLPGLDADDHEQYLLADGGRPLAGDLDLDGHQLLRPVVQNASEEAAPEVAGAGQLWWNTTLGSLMVFDGLVWVPVGTGIEEGASDLDCVGCVSGTEVDFAYASSTIKGGPATGLECDACVDATDISAEYQAALDAWYAPAGHSHGDFADADHGHADLAAGDHGHADLAAADHGHADLAAAGHDHDTAYVEHGELDSVTGDMVTDGALTGLDLADDAAIAASQVAGVAATLTGDQTFDGGTLHVAAATDRVGVRTTDPQAALHVNGDLFVRGEIRQLGDAPVVGDSDWMPMPFRTLTTLPLHEASDPIVFAMLRSDHYLAGRVTLPFMGSTAVDYAPAFIGHSGGSLTLLAWDHLVAINNLGDRHNILIRGADVRYRAFERAADFDSGWVACENNTQYVFQHAVGKLPDFVYVEVAENDDGSGWRVPTMSASNHSGGWRQTAIIGLTASSVTVRTHGSLAYFRYNQSGNTIAPSEGFCRVRLYDWAPDYQSEWTAISTAQGNRDKWFHHELGRVPSLVMVYVAENADGSGWLIPSLGGFHSGYNQAASLYALNEHWAVVKGGSGSVAHFVNGGGSGQSPNSGYVRFAAWR